MQQELAELTPEKLGLSSTGKVQLRSVEVCCALHILGHLSPRVLHASRETRTGSLRRNPGITCEQLKTKEGESDRSRTMNSRRDLGTRENRGRITCNQVPNRPGQCFQGKTPTSELWLDGQVSPKKLGTAAVTGLLMVATVGHRRREPPQNLTPEEGTRIPVTLGAQVAQG